MSQTITDTQTGYVPSVYNTLVIPSYMPDGNMLFFKPKNYLDVVYYCVDLDNKLMAGDTIISAKGVANDPSLTLKVTQLNPRSFYVLIGKGQPNSVILTMFGIVTQSGANIFLNIAIKNGVPSISLDGSSDPQAIVAGMSAYQVAVANGFSGTENDWLSSLVGGLTKDSITQALGFTPASSDSLDLYLPLKGGKILNHLEIGGDLNVDGAISTANSISASSFYIGDDSTDVLVSQKWLLEQGFITSCNLPIASKTNLGAVSIGKGLMIDSKGSLSSQSDYFVNDGTLSLDISRIKSDKGYITSDGKGALSVLSININGKRALTQSDLEGLLQTPYQLETPISYISYTAASGLYTIDSKGNRYYIPDKDWVARFVESSSPELTLPIASDSVLGGIKVGSGLVIADDGTLSNANVFKNDGTETLNVAHITSEAQVYVNGTDYSLGLISSKSLNSVQKSKDGSINDCYVTDPTIDGFNSLKDTLAEIANLAQINQPFEITDTMWCYMLSLLPTQDPNIKGSFWNNNGILTASQAGLLFTKNVNNKIYIEALSAWLYNLPNHDLNKAGTCFNNNGIPTVSSAGIGNIIYEDADSNSNAEQEPSESDDQSNLESYDITQLPKDRPVLYETLWLNGGIMLANQNQVFVMDLTKLPKERPIISDTLWLNGGLLSASNSSTTYYSGIVINTDILNFLFLGLAQLKGDSLSNVLTNLWVNNSGVLTRI